MDCTSFRQNVLAYIDRELADAMQVAAAEHERICGPCAGRARAERAFEARTRTALLASVPAGAFERLFAAARERAEQPAAEQAVVEGDGAPREAAARKGAGRVVPFQRAARAIVSLAAVALVAVTAMWSLCIPPFECAYLQAVEAAATTAPGRPLPAPGARSGVLARFEPPARLLSFDRIGEPETVALAYRGGARAVRASYEAGGEGFTILWSDLIGSCPSFRRHVERDGLEWWIAEENGRHIVTFLCPETQTLCALVGTLSEQRLREIATAMRLE